MLQDPHVPRRSRKGKSTKALAQAELNEYEEQRLRNIAHNERLLAELELPKLSLPLTLATATASRGNSRKSSATTSKKTANLNIAASLPRRASKRLRGVEPAIVTKKEADAVEVDGEEPGEKRAATPEPDLDDGHLMPAEKFFSAEILRNAIRTDGHFHGWINPDLITKHGFEENAQDSWEKHGGGKFSFSNPLGLPEDPKAKKARGRKAKAGGASSARLVAAKLFKKNPNSYFYRHNEPGVEQRVGDWEEDEKTLFLQAAKEHGCGDKWGLFSSYIPHRFGYQCSNYYRQVILPEGLIIDPNYRYNGRGQAIYVGPYNRGRN